MAEKKITVADRVKSIKPGSSTYNYYMTTPLSELNSREDKLVKKELQRLALLSEDNDNLDMSPSYQKTSMSTAMTQPVNIPPEEPNTSTDIVPVETPVENNIDNNAESNDVVTQIQEFLEDKTEEITEEDSDSETNSGEGWSVTSAYHYSIGKVSELFTSVSSWLNTKLQSIGYGNEGDTSMASNIATATLAGALAIIALYAVWKVYRWFVRDDGDEKEKSEATSEAKYISNQIEKDILSGRYVPVSEMGNPFSNKFNPIYNNVALAIIQESSTESEEAKEVIDDSTENRSNGFIINCAIRFSNNMLNDDPKFINYMNKNKPKIIISVQKWKDQAESFGTIEATQENKSIIYTARDGNRYTILNEADSQEDINNTNNVDTSEDVIAKLEANNTDEESKGFFAKIKDKLAEIKNRFESNSNKAIRWIPNIIKLALGVLAVAAVYYGGRKYLFKVEEGTIPSDITDDDTSTSVNNSDSNITTDTEEPLPTDEEIDKEVTMATNENNCSLASYKFINTYLNSMSIISETVEKVEESNIPNKEKVLDDLTGKGEELGDNIIEKAKSVSIDLLNDKEFITFANKNKITVVNDFKKALDNKDKE